jgi:hypothetical protein
MRIKCLRDDPRLAQPTFLVYMKLINPVTGELVKNADGMIGAMSGVFQVLLTLSSQQVIGR